MRKCSGRNDLSHSFGRGSPRSTKPSLATVTLLMATAHSDKKLRSRQQPTCLGVSTSKPTLWPTVLRICPICEGHHVAARCSTSVRAFRQISTNPFCGFWSRHAAETDGVHQPTLWRAQFVQLVRSWRAGLGLHERRKSMSRRDARNVTARVAVFDEDK